jgi:hypothetical protein
MKTSRALLALSLLAGLLSACNPLERFSASEGDIALCVYLDRQSAGKVLSVPDNLLAGATDGFIVGLVTSLLDEQVFIYNFSENTDFDSVLARCRKIGAL